jgi:hypothetical protein
MLGHHNQGENKNYLKVARGLPLNRTGVSGGKIATESEPERRESTDLERRCAEWVKCGENREKPLGKT